MDEAIDAAIEAGFRHFDTAESYENEELIGNSLAKALKKHSVLREDIFITSKIPPWRMDKESAKDSIESSL